MSKIRNTLGRNLKKIKENDKISAERRSENMSKIRSRSTKFEIDFVSELRKHIGDPFVLNDKRIKGKPDIVFESERLLVFLDSDFWHGWQFDRWKHLLKNGFWVDKIDNNRKRDKRTTLYLRRKGWVVLRIWEHNIKKNIDNEIAKIKNKLDL